MSTSTINTKQLKQPKSIFTKTDIKQPTLQDDKKNYTRYVVRGQ